MNARDRFLAVMNFDSVPTLKWEFGYWGGTVRRWYREGLAKRVGIPDTWEDGRSVHGGTGVWAPDRVRDIDVRDTMGLDEGLQNVFINNYFCPVFQEHVLEEHETWQLVQDERGILMRRPRNLDSPPGYVRGPVVTRRDWEKLKAERLNPALGPRLPAGWKELLEGYRQRTYPLAIGGGHGFYGTPRYLFGETQVLTAFYDSPDLLHDIIADLTDFWIALYDQVLDLVDVDLALIWEDMSYKSGPLISPHMFREFLLPGYKKLTGFFRDRGVRNILVDSDGNVWKLLPLFVEGGVTGVYPFEVNGGMDIVAVRKEFPRLQILGGLDKMTLIQGPAAIDAELAAKVPWMLRQSGCIPHTDHNVPPDVSWANFQYYRKRLNALIDESQG